jgi:hypothetical protein
VQPDIVTALESAAPLEDIPFVSIHSVPGRTGDIDAALAGTFRLRDERFALAPPVDWWDIPYSRPDERGFFQNSFVFADPLLADPRFPEVLAPLAELCVDWLAANPRTGAAHPHRYAWHDHAAAGRIVIIAFVLREGVRRELLDRATATTLAAGAAEHAEFLLAEENYAARHNHGFASDAALTLAARSLEPAPQARRWAEVAGERFATVLAHMIDTEEGVHLEHSPYYHWIIHGALRRFADAGLFEDLGLERLIQRMEESGRWLVAPDGTLPPFGDTPYGQRPSRGSLGEEPPRGMRVFGAAGYAAVRAGDAALFVTAAHHPTAHKHADDGSFCLYEGGRPIVLDSGCPGYEYESPEFRYGTSPAAHATVCVDGFDWVGESPAYGSGIIASAEGEDLYALLTRNPGAAPGGGAARRLLLYRPRAFLIAIDDVEAGPDHQLVRSLPLAPGLDAVPTAEGLEIRDGEHTVARLVQLAIRGRGPDGVEMTVGQAQPEMGGFRFPKPEDPRPGCDVRLVGPAGHPRGYALLLAEHPQGRPVEMTWNASGSWVGVRLAGATDSPLEIEIGERSLGLR